MNVKRSGDFFVVDYADLTVGAPAGDRQVIECPKCKRPGIQWRGTRAVAHLVRVRRLPGSHKEEATVVVGCKAALPKHEPPPVTQTGFSWCPPEWL